MISERFESNIGQNRLRISKIPLNSIICKCYLENTQHSINNKTKNTFSNKLKIQNKLKYTIDWENNRPK